MNNYPPLQALFFRDWKNAHIPDILEEIYMKKVYDHFLVGKKDLTIVDVGSNIGLTAFYFSTYAKRVICLEPSEMHRETCREMLEYNMITNVEVYPYGLSNKKEKKKLYLHENSTAFSLTALGDAKNIKTEEIETITVDDIFTLGKIEGDIDIFKLDCEGEESKVITSDSFIKNKDRIRCILGEFHDWTDMSQHQFMTYFRDLGYNFFWNRNTQAKTFSAVKI